MKTAIVYASRGTGNTKKLVDAIASVYDVDVIDATACSEYDLTDYDRIGFASGIAFGKYYPEVSQFAETNLPEGRAVFLLHTAADPRESHADEMKVIAEACGCKVIGIYYCKGLNTFGPFKLVGGIGKGHPTTDEINGAVRFYQKNVG